jgi:hypothetical protein
MPSWSLRMAATMSAVIPIWHKRACSIVEGGGQSRHKVTATPSTPSAAHTHLIPAIDVKALLRHFSFQGLERLVGRSQ